MISVPTLLLNEDICRQNIRMMAEKARRNNVIFRPHFKTHVSREIGEWFRQEGVDRITVSSLSMADYFTGSGWKDILVAFPVNILEIDTIRKLSETIRLTLLVESADTVRFLAGNINSPVDIYIKVDTGYHRTGIFFSDIDSIREVIARIEECPMMKFTGFLTHAGNSYSAHGADEIFKVHEQSVTAMHSLKDEFSGSYPGLIISTGDTPSCSIVEDLDMIDEIRPGNFVFYDLMQVLIGSCTPGMVAVAMACPVVAVHRERNEIVIYGGSVHFSKDCATDSSGRMIFGAVVENTGNGWGNIVENAVLSKLSQEHGIVEAPPEFIRRFKPGDLIKIMPVHSCLTANLMREYWTLEGRRISRY